MLSKKEVPNVQIVPVVPSDPNVRGRSNRSISVPIDPNVPNASRTIRTLTSFRTGKTNGFTLIEVLIAAAIFVVFAGAIISLFTLSSKNVVVNKHRLEATNLAREGIELVTQIKETASIRGQDWESGCWKIDAGNRILVKDNSDPSCDANTWRLIDGANDPILLSADSITYRRTIGIENVGGDANNKKISVTVSWEDYGRPHEATEVTYLTKWQ